jgi:hypothetical protein
MGSDNKFDVVYKMPKDILFSGNDTNILNQDEDIENKLIKSYAKHKSIRKVGKELGMSREVVRVRLKKIGVLNKQIRYRLDDDYFSRVTEHSLYWAGFIAADGAVVLRNGKYKRLYIGLSQKDHDHLEKFKYCLGFTGPVHKINGSTKCSEVAVYSGKIYDDLARFNIIPRKTLVYEFPEWLVGHDLVNHFMRGYFDGDGSFYGQSKPNIRKSKIQLYFSLRGTKKFLSVFNDILEEKCFFEVSKKVPRYNSGIYTLEYGGNKKVGKIRDFLYAGSYKDIRLDRKYNICFDEKFTCMPDGNRNKAVIGTNINTGSEIALESMLDGKSYGFTPQGISACCRGKYREHKGYTWRYV